MPFTTEEFKTLTERHGRYGSWAIWSYLKGRTGERSCDPITENVHLLNSKHVVIGLNISKPVSTWGNFRGGTHDRKLKYAFNDSDLKGCYMTDLFKDVVNPNSTSFNNYIESQPHLTQHNVNLFRQEMSNLKITPETTFTLMGTEQSILATLYQKYFRIHFPDTKLIYHRHYSSRGSDKEWVESIWQTLGIMLDYN
jgi:hypothetical protein